MRPALLLAALVGVALTTGGAAASAPTPFSIHIAVNDHGFGFRNIGIRAAKVRLYVVNRGKHRHDLAVARRGTTGSKGSSVIAATKSLSPGQSAELTLKLRPGHYRLFSKLDHDRRHGLSAPLAMMAPTLKGGAEMNRVFYNYY